MSETFFTDRIARYEALIIAYEDALLFFAENESVQSYSLDTGQTRQTVQRAEISSLNNTLAKLMSQYDDLLARCEGAVSQVRSTR